MPADDAFANLNAIGLIAPLRPTFVRVKHRLYQGEIYVWIAIGWGLLSAVVL